MKKSEFPPGWDAERARRVAEYYENQSDDEAIAEAEAAWRDEKYTMMSIPTRLVPRVRELILRESDD